MSIEKKQLSLEEIEAQTALGTVPKRRRTAMRRRLLAMTLIIALTSLCVLPPTGALAAPGGGGLVQNITFLLNGEPTAGILTIRNFTPSQQQLFAMGTLSFTDPDGISRHVPVRLPVTDITTQQQDGTCQILFLDL